MISIDRFHELVLEEVKEEYEKLYAECEELKKIKRNAIKAFQVLWAETHTKTAWSAHIFAQNMLLSFFGGQKAFNEAKKKRKELINTICFKGEALDLFVTELEQELKDYKKKYEDLQDKKECLKERYEEVLEVLKNKIQELDRYKQALDEIEDYCKLGAKGCLTDCPEYAVGQGCSQNCYENRLKVFLDIINKAKEVKNDNF